MIPLEIEKFLIIYICKSSCCYSCKGSTMQWLKLVKYRTPLVFSMYKPNFFNKHEHKLIVGNL